MAVPAQLIQHIESFVDLSCSPTQQDSSLNAIASLLKNDTLTIEALVKEMEMYLTTTDNIIRARGILLLAELLTSLATKPLENSTVHSLIVFFKDKLADWKALRGALVGCLTLLRRKTNAGVVSSSDAKAVAQSFLQNLQVQALGQYDRKLCFELLECLLTRYPSSVVALGDDLPYAICEAIDAEKDPQCLMLTFHIVEVLARLFPDPSGPLASYAEDLFEILACYFPIHFTHPKSEDVEVKRDDLSRALMLAFSSTPLFEPFAIPLLLEKLSSALPSAKLDSLKYLSNCTLKYGADRMAKHAEAIWSSLKDVIYASPQEPISSLTSEPLDGIRFQDNEITKEALILLQKVILQNCGLFISLIIGDEGINMIIDSIEIYTTSNDITLQSKQKLHAVGSILHVSAKASVASCNRVFESFFLRLMGALELSVKNSSGFCVPADNDVVSEKLNFGALYLCIELIDACRYMIAGFEELTANTVSADETCCSMLRNFSSSLFKAFSSTLVTSISSGAHDADIYLRVKGLQTLATFSGGFSTISKSTFENILMTFTSVITTDFNSTLLWRQTLKALVKIGLFVDQSNESEKTTSYMSIVVDKIVSKMSFNDDSMPFPLNLEAICDIGETGLNFMLRVVQGLEEAISANLSDIYVHGNLKSAEIVVQLFECLCNKVLPWFHKTGYSDKVPLRFAIIIWNQVENSSTFSDKVLGKELLNATMMAMKIAVGNCSEENQSTILEKAYSVLSSRTSFPLKESMSLTIPVQLDGLQLMRNLDGFSSVDDWLLSLFASVTVALRPRTHIPNVRIMLHTFVTASLKGNVPSAQALGSIVNKLHVKNNESERSHDCTLEEAIDIIFNKGFWSSIHSGPLRRCSELSDRSEMGLINLCNSVVNDSLLQIHALVGLAWVGKGLLMRGHEKVKEIIMIFFKCLVSNGEVGDLQFKKSSLEEGSKEVVPSVMKSAADAFHILMSDSEVCLNKRFHAIARPLYKQRFFSTVMPILLPSILKSDSPVTRSMMFRAFGHVISDTPHVAILGEAKKLIPILLDGISTLSEENKDNDMIYNLLLVLSRILMDINGQEVVEENAHKIINCLTGLVSFPHMMLVRETAIQCLVAMAELPHMRIYPLRLQVLRAMSKALDDPKRAVRQEAVRCHQKWASIASRSLYF